MLVPARVERNNDLPAAGLAAVIASLCCRGALSGGCPADGTPGEHPSSSTEPSPGARVADGRLWDVFSVDDRDKLRAHLIGAARRDPQIDAAAVLGSTARGTEDRWSDIDLALRVAPGVELSSVADRWTERLQRAEVVIDQLDVHASGGLCRVFLLASTLQVDLSFWPHGQLVTGGAPIQLLFGEADATTDPGAGEHAIDHLRMTWLYALHVRSAIARGRGWQAVWMLEGIRNRLISMYCLRYGLTPDEGRGVDALPMSVRADLTKTLVTGTDSTSLRHSFRILITMLLAEAECQSLPVPVGLDRALDQLVTSADPHSGY